MKQTAVEYITEMIKLNDKEFYAMLFEDKVFEKAKAMEKEQLCYFYVKGAEAELNNPYVTNIEFYNQTFKSE